MSIIVEPTNVIVVQQPQTTVTVTGQGQLTVQKPAATTVVLQQSAIQVVSIGTQGPAGPPGTGSAITANAGVTITAFTAVVMIAGLVYPADPTNPTHAPLVAGIATNGGAEGNPINIVTNGDIIGMSGLTTGRYYAGLDGGLSTSVTAPDATWIKSLGWGKSDAEFVLLPGPSILL